MNPMPLKPAVVVTGASSGIGRALARRAAQDGSFMVLVATSQSGLDEAVAEINAEGHQACALCLDLRKPQVGCAIQQFLAERALYCDVLINCAGFGLYGSAATVNIKSQLDLLDVNVRALTELTLLFLPGMLQRNRGGVLNVGSITSYLPGPYMAAYFASKAFVRSFSSALSSEVAGTSVSVTCLNPGVVRTAFFERCPVPTRLYKLAPRGNIETTADAGWRAFKAGRTVVIPRLVDRLLIGISEFLPTAVVAQLIAVLQRPPRSPIATHSLEPVGRDQ